MPNDLNDSKNLVEKIYHLMVDRLNQNDYQIHVMFHLFQVMI